MALIIVQAVGDPRGGRHDLIAVVPVTLRALDSPLTAENSTRAVLTVSCDVTPTTKQLGD
jgi:hypothetical protein